MKNEAGLELMKGASQGRRIKNVASAPEGRVIGFQRRICRVIQNPPSVSREGVDRICANKAGATGNEDFHCEIGQVMRRILFLSSAKLDRQHTA